MEQASSSTTNPRTGSSSDESDNLTAIATGRDRRSSEWEAVRADTLSRRPTNLNDVELERINTYRLQHRSTVGSGPGPAPRSEWLSMGAGKPYPPTLPDPEQFVVEFTDANDPLHPQNWPLRKKVTVSVVLAYSTFASSFPSAIYSSAVSEISPQFHIGAEVATLGVTLYVLGFASGPTLWAPASELIGRRWPIAMGVFGYSIFTVGAATSKDVQTLMLTRFFPGFFAASTIAIMVDATSISTGFLLGSPPVTAFVESGAGISEGGKTGLTSCMTEIAFFISVFFAPIFASIPAWATGCTLVIVGALMAKAAADIDWRYYGDAIPAFLTIAIMPFTYSIAYGLIAGILSYITLNGVAWTLEKVSGGRIVPPKSDPWSWKVPGGFLPPWVKRAAGGGRGIFGGGMRRGISPRGWVLCLRVSRRLRRSVVVISEVCGGDVIIWDILCI